MSRQLKELVEAVPPQSWRMMEEKGGVIREWAKIAYVPSRKSEKRDSRPYRAMWG